MKLHLPKQLFTALLAAITLAAPAAWGADMIIDGTGNTEINTSTSVAGETITFQMTDANSSSESNNYFSGGGVYVTAADIVISDDAASTDTLEGWVITNGNQGNHQVYTGSLTGNGILKKVGNGNGNYVTFEGNATGYTGDMYLGSSYRFELTFGGRGSAVAATKTTADKGIAGTGDVFFSANNNHLNFNYSASENPVYITNAISESSACTSTVNLKGGANYIFTKSVAVDTIDIAAETSWTLQNNRTFNAEGGVKGDGTLIIDDGATAEITATKAIKSHVQVNGGGTLKSSVVDGTWYQSDSSTKSITLAGTSTEKMATFEVTERQTFITPTYMNGYAQISGSGSLQLFNGATFTVSGTNNIISTALTTSRASVFDIAEGGTLEISGQITRNTSNANNDSITKKGAGKLIFSNAGNSIQGGLIIEAGEVTIKNSAGSTNFNVVDTTVKADAKLVFDNGNDMVKYNGDSIQTITLDGGTWELGTGRQTLGNNNYLVLNNGTVNGTNKYGSDGDDYGALDFYNVGNKVASDNASIISTGISSITGGIRLRKNIDIDVQDGVLTADAILNGNNTQSGITKKGNGTLKLTMSNTYNEGMYVGGTVISGGVVEFAMASDQSYAGVISGVGSLAKSGSSNLTLSGANTYSGGTTIEAGTVTTQNASALGTGGVTMTGGILNVTNVADADTDLTVGGAIVMNADATAKLATTGTTLSLGTTGSVKKTNADGTQHVTIASNGTNAASLTARSANAQLTQLQADATFTIEDMTLTNTTITAATPTTQVNLQNVEGSTALLEKGAFTLHATPTVGEAPSGESRGTLSYSNGLAIATDDNASLTLNLDVVNAVAGDAHGTYDLTITLSGFGANFAMPENIREMVSFDSTSWLGQALGSQKEGYSEVTEQTPATAGESGVPTVSYSAVTVDNVGSLVITIAGLNVPEPATATLSLLALAALAARRRRND